MARYNKVLDMSIKSFSNIGKHNKVKKISGLMDRLNKDLRTLKSNNNDRYVEDFTSKLHESISNGDFYTKTGSLKKGIKFLEGMSEGELDRLFMNIKNIKTSFDNKSVSNFYIKSKTYDTQLLDSNISKGIKNMMKNSGADDWENIGNNLNLIHQVKQMLEEKKNIYDEEIQKSMLQYVDDKKDEVDKRLKEYVRDIKSAREITNNMDINARKNRIAENSGLSEEELKQAIEQYKRGEKLR